MKVSNPEAAKVGLEVLKQLGHITSELRQLPEIGPSSPTQNVLPLSVVDDKRRYLVTISRQINGTYENGWYDACAVMMRKLIECLIIEVFEAHGLEKKIQVSGGNFGNLGMLIGKVIGESSWNLSRQTQQVLRDVKNFGDNSAHNRRYTTHRGDIDSIRVQFRVAAQELVVLCKWS